MFLNPQQCVAQCALKEGMRVADFGAGTGVYSLAAARHVGHTGCVYAVEVQKDLVERFESELKSKHITNASVIWGDIEKNGGTKIADRSMDLVILSNVLFQAEDKLGVIDETKRVLKKGGRVLVIDWTDSFGNLGPTPSRVVTKKAVEDLFTKRGFEFTETVSTGEHHYGIIFSA